MTRHARLARDASHDAPPPPPGRVRCAVYTRKSSEEGLDQAFNSLDAQREAGLDYIRSQKHQGWVAVSDSGGGGFDDGGYSGGNTDRPGLARLLAEIDAGRIDVVVVYKVDRLSRSLADFARLMQLFDERGVSFVSVTQQFNTTTSMGRLTLNMLLSFAQFEREVTGERIRDKIAATMKKGLWTHGTPPLGYRRALPTEPAGIHVVPDEAAVVRQIFEGYAAKASLVALAQDLAARDVFTRSLVSKAGVERGRRRFTATALYKVLTNPVYIGKITHTRRASARGEVRTEVYDGVHEPIIARELWDRVQDRMQRAKRDERVRWTHTHLLRGKLRTAEGFAMSPSNTKRRDSSGAAAPPYLYYVSQKAMKHGYASCPIKSVNAACLDDVVRGMVLDEAASKGHQSTFDDPSKRDAVVRDLVREVVVGPERLTVTIDAAALRSLERDPAAQPGSSSAPPRRCVFTPSVVDDGDSITLALDVRIRKLDGRRLLVAPSGQDLLATHGRDGASGRTAARAPDPTIVRAIGLAYAALRLILAEHLSLDEAARRLAVPRSTVKYVLPIAQLGPVPLHAALTGSLPPRTTVKRLLRVARELDWQKQQERMGR